jgi:hypothetical protein
MTTHTPAASRRARRFTAARFAVRVGADWSPIRAATIWPIADVLAAEAGFAAPQADPEPSPETAERLVLDLIDSGMIAPPRPRRRRERPVSSRAVFYQAES